MPAHVPFFQRFQSADPLALASKVEQDYEELAEMSATDNKPAHLEILSRLGSRLTILGKEQEAAPLLEQALMLAKCLDEKRLEVAILLNLATALQYLGQRNMAQSLFQEALDKSKAYEQLQYEDFILHHRGRCFVEQGQMEQAKACFEQALMLRAKRGDQRGIASTQCALDALQAQV